MTPQEKYSLHLPYGLKVEHTTYFCNGDKKIIIDNLDSLSKECMSFSEGADYYFEDKIDNDCDVKPYLRSFDQLNKPITQKDYNDGKSFVPMEELSNVINHTLTYNEIDGFSDCYTEDFTEEWLPLNAVQQLLKWNFAIGFEPGEYIECTDDNNPYK